MGSGHADLHTDSEGDPEMENRGWSWKKKSIAFFRKLL